MPDYDQHVCPECGRVLEENLSSFSASVEYITEVDIIEVDGHSYPQPGSIDMSGDFLYYYCSACGAQFEEFDKLYPIETEEDLEELTDEEIDALSNEELEILAQRLEKDKEK